MEKYSGFVLFWVGASWVTLEMDTASPSGQQAPAAVTGTEVKVAAMMLPVCGVIWML